VMLQVGFVGILVVAQFQPGLIWKTMWAMFGLSTALLGLTERRTRVLQATDPQPEVAPLRSSTGGLSTRARVKPVHPTA
jgi:hypothetical protein